jgi:hypothetical protein
MLFPTTRGQCSAAIWIRSRFLIAFVVQQAKAPFFQQCIHLAKKRPDVPLVMIGDFKTDRNDLDIEGNGKRFFCGDLFQALTNVFRLED